MAGLGITGNFIGDEDAFDPMVDEDLRFPKRSAGHPNGPGADLLAGQHGALVVLEMRPQLRRCLGKEPRHTMQIELHRIKVDQQSRRIDFFYLHLGQKLLVELDGELFH